MFVRDKGQCIVCHASSRTQGVPGHLVRSVFSDKRGQPKFGSGTFTTDHRSPFEERWGGWYVTGMHGRMRHMGNVFPEDPQQPEVLNRDAGANRADLESYLNIEPYLEPTSDIVSLMVLEHQTQMHNLITFAAYEARSATYYDGIMNEALDRAADYRSESTERRIAAAGEKLLKYLLFTEEFELTSPVTGSSNFSDEFARRGPHDSRGRSLREFNLTTRLFKYPCSYLIYSPSFDALPTPMHKYVGGRLSEILSGRDQSPAFARLTVKDRQAVREILNKTKPGLLSDNRTVERKEAN